MVLYCPRSLPSYALCWGPPSFARGVYRRRSDPCLGRYADASPALIAYLVSSAALWTPSLLTTFRRCVSTVFTDSCERRAISPDE